MTKANPTKKVWLRSIILSLWFRYEITTPRVQCDDVEVNPMNHHDFVDLYGISFSQLMTDILKLLSPETKLYFFTEIVLAWTKRQVPHVFQNLLPNPEHLRSSGFCWDFLYVFSFLCCVLYLLYVCSWLLVFLNFFQWQSLFTCVIAYSFDIFCLWYKFSDKVNLSYCSS